MQKKENNKKKKYVAGGKRLASIPGYMSLLAKRSNGTISPETFKRKSKKLLATLKQKNQK